MTQVKKILQITTPHICTKKIIWTGFSLIFEKIVTKTWKHGFKENCIILIATATNT